MHDMILDGEWHDDHDIVDITPRCPKCQSPCIEPRNIASRFGGAIGAIAGTVIRPISNGSNDDYRRNGTRPSPRWSDLAG